MSMTGKLGGQKEKRNDGDAVGLHASANKAWEGGAFFKQDNNIIFYRIICTLGFPAGSGSLLARKSNLQMESSSNFRVFKKERSNMS